MPVNRRRVLTAAGLATTSALAGCLGDDESTASLWHGFGVDASNDLDDDISTFGEETGQSVNAEAVDDLEQQIESTIPVDQGPELFGWAHDWLGDLKQRDFLYDAREDVTLDLNAHFVDQAVNAAQFEDGLYGLPHSAETVTLLYNTEHVDEPPSTVAELVETAESAHDPDEDVYGLVAPIDPFWISGWLHAGDGFYYDPETETVGVDHDATVEALEYYRDTLWPLQPDSGDYDDQVDPFHDGDAAFAIVTPVEYDFDDEDIDEKNVGATALPTADIGEPSPYVQVQLWYFSRIIDATDGGGLFDWLLGGDDDDGEAGEIAIEFAQWHTTNGTIARQNATEHRSVPVLSSVAEEIDDDPVSAYSSSMRAGQAIPAVPAMRAVWEPVGEAIQDVLVDGDDPSSALGDARDRIDDELETLPGRDDTPRLYQPTTPVESRQR